MNTDESRIRYSNLFNTWIKVLNDHKSYFPYKWTALDLDEFGKKRVNLHQTNI